MLSNNRQVLKFRLGYAYLVSIVLVLCLSAYLSAEQGILVVHVTDVSRKPIAKVEIGLESGGASALTDKSGIAHVRLAATAQAGSPVNLQIIGSPPGKAFVIISDNRVIVPSFENSPSSYVSLTVCERGSRAILESSSSVAELVKRILKDTPPKSSSEPVEVSQERAMTKVAESVGLSTSDLDAAIRERLAKSKDPFEKGMSDLYLRRFPQASKELELSVQIREAEMDKAQQELVSSLFFLGTSLYEQGRFSEAVERFERANRIFPNDPLITNRLAMGLLSLGKESEAERILKRLIDGPNRLPDPVFAMTLQNLASVRFSRGLFSEARRLLTEALEVNKRLFGDNDPVVAMNMISLGLVYRANADFQKAEQLTRDALRIMELHPDNRVGIDNAYNNLGTVLSAAGKTEDAKECFEKALVLLRQEFGYKHPIESVVLMNLGGMALRRKELDKAKTYFDTACNITESTLGSDHPDFARCLVSQARVQSARGENATAEALLDRALLIRRRAFGDDHIMIAETLEDKARVLQADRNFSGAESSSKEAISIEKRVLGACSRELAMSQSGLALTLHEENKDTEAEPIAKESLECLKQLSPPDRLAIANVQNNLALVLMSKGDLSTAQNLLEEALAAVDVLIFPKDERVVNVLENLGAVRMRVGDYGGAEKYYRLALNACDDSFTTADSVTIRILRDLASSLSAQGNEVQAQQNRDRANSMERQKH